MTTYALIPAAGKSRRMGRSKLLLPIGTSTVLESVLSAIRAAGIQDTLVGVAPDADALAEVARSAGTHVLRLDEDTPDMRATCLHGLAWIEQHFQPRPEDGWLLLPADHPTVNPEVVRALMAAVEEHPEMSIFVPTFAGRRGHPTWLRWSHVPALRALPPGQGLNTFIREHGSKTCEVDWPSDEILRDLDTPGDYARLTQGD
jgi:molybdenum cofactor cytidylyltransferase